MLHVHRSDRADGLISALSGLLADAPADHPRIALAVLVENGGFGAQAAAPIARQVFDYVLAGEKKPGPAPAFTVPETEDQSD